MLLVWGPGPRNWRFAPVFQVALMETHLPHYRCGLVSPVLWGQVTWTGTHAWL